MSDADMAFCLIGIPAWTWVCIRTVILTIRWIRERRARASRKE